MLLNVLSEREGYCVVIWLLSWFLLGILLQLFDGVLIWVRGWLCDWLIFLCKIYYMWHWFVVGVEICVFVICVWHLRFVVCVL